MSRRRRSRIQFLVVPLFLAALSVGVLVGFVNMGPEPQIGKVTNRTLVDGAMVATIVAPAPFSPDLGSAVIAELVLPIEYHTQTTVPVRVLSDGSVEIAETGFRMPGTRVSLVAALLGVMLGLVAIFNMRGYGFVRGTGALGTMQPSEVDEDRGFYWRS